MILFWFIQISAGHGVPSWAVCGNVTGWRYCFESPATFPKSLRAIYHQHDVPGGSHHSAAVCSVFMYLPY